MATLCYRTLYIYNIYILVDRDITHSRGYVMYNVKLLRYHDELQLNWYSYGISTKEKKEEVNSNENNKRNSAPGKQSNKPAKQSDSVSNEIDNKIRSTRRTKQSIYNISRANKWDYFSTFTFEKNRYDYDICKKNLQTFLKNTKNRVCPGLEYLAVPEQHKDGAYHFHALLKGVTDDIICDSYEKGKLMFKNWRYGISQLEEVKETNRVAMYITKYITKELVEDVKNRQRYLCSNGVKRAEEQTMYVNDMSLFEFYENNLSDYDILYNKKCSRGGYEVNYVQLKKKVDLENDRFFE